MRVRLPTLSGKRKGIILFETLIGIMLLGMFLVTASLALLAGQQTLLRSGNRIRAFFYASRALEAARTIPYSSLTAGYSGLSINATTKKWQLIANTPQKENGFTTSILVQNLTDGKRITAVTRWKEQTNTGSIALSTEIADWRGSIATGDWAHPTVTGIDYSPSQLSFSSMTFGSGGFAFVTSKETNGKLYGFNLGTNTWNSIPAASFSFTLGTNQRGIAAAVRGNRLYVLLTTPPSALTGTGFELREYNITHPTAFGANPSNFLVDSYQQANLRPLSMTIADTRLYIGMSNLGLSTGMVVSFDISNSGSIMLSGDQQSFRLGGSINAINITGTSAFLATSNTGHELMARERFSLSARQGAASKPTPSYPATGVAAIGSSALIVSSGRDADGAVRIYDLQSFNVLVATPELPGRSYGFRDVVTDPAGSYAFIGAIETSTGYGDLVVGSTSLVAPYWTSWQSVLRSALNLQYPGINAVVYAAFKDRLFLLTDSSILLLIPG